MTSVRPKAGQRRIHSPGARKKGGKSKRSAYRAKAEAYSLPPELSDTLDDHRKELHFALSILNSVDASLERTEDGGIDTFDINNPAEASLLKARDIARPLDLLRLAIQRIYEVHAGMDSVHLARPAGAGKGAHPHATCHPSRH
jgi:hypothetical protein